MLDELLRNENADDSAEYSAAEANHDQEREVLYHLMSSFVVQAEMPAASRRRAFGPRQCAKL